HGKEKSETRRPKSELRKSRGRWSIPCSAFELRIFVPPPVAHSCCAESQSAKDYHGDRGGFRGRGGRAHWNLVARSIIVRVAEEGHTRVAAICGITQANLHPSKEQDTSGSRILEFKRQIQMIVAAWIMTPERG